MPRSCRSLTTEQPIGISERNELVFGERRLTAARLLGWTEIEATVIDISKPGIAILAEHDENVVRKEFAPSELYAITEARRERVEADAKGRQIELGKQSTRTDLEDPSGKFPEGCEPNSAPTIEPEARRTNNVLAKPLGISGRTLDKIKTIVEAAKAEPEKYGDLAKRMDDSGKVDGPFNDLKRRQDRERVTAIAPRVGRYRTLLIDPPTPANAVRPVTTLAQCQHATQHLQHAQTRCPG